MSEDSTATRITLYLASIWLVVGELGLFDHFHNRSVGALVIAGVVGVITAGGFMVVTWTKRVPVKLIAEPLTMVGVVGSAVGFFFHPYAWLTIGVGLLILFAFGAALFEERRAREQEARLLKAKLTAAVKEKVTSSNDLI
jgi:hypothetical protein